MPQEPSPERLTRPGWLFTLLPVIIVILIAASYSNSLNSPAILDDNHSFLFTSKLQLNDLSWQSIKSLKDSEFGVTRLLPILSLAFNNYFSNDRAIDYHLTNITFHLLALFALLFFLKQLLRLPRANCSLKITSPALMASAVAGLWALNPVQTNAVTYIVQRMAILCALFYVLCLGLYIMGRRADSFPKAIACHAGALFAAICAFMSKENSATLPLAILFLEDTFISPGCVRTFTIRLVRDHWRLIAILLLLLTPLLQVTWENQVVNAYNMRSFSLGERLLTESRIVVWYLSLLLLPLPSRMNLDHDTLVSHSLFSPPTTILSILVLAAILVLAYRTRRSMPLVAFGIMFFFLNLIIESTVIPLELIFEHRLYLPSMGLFLALLALADQGLSRLPNSNSTEFGNLMVVTLIILFAGYSLLTTFRNNTYLNDVTIYKDMAEKSPNKARPVCNYGMALARNNQTQEAITVLTRAFEIGRPYQEAYFATLNNLLIAYQQNGQIEEAIIKTKKLQEKVPAYANLNHLDRLYHNLAYAYYQINQFDKAFENIKQAMLLFPQESNSFSVAFCMEILGKAFNQPAWKEKLGLEGATAEEAILVKTTETLIDVRDYSKAEELIAKLAKLNPDKAKEKAAALKAILQKNNSATEASDIRNDPSIKNSFSLRWRVNLAQFISRSYPPLTPLAHFLLEQAEQQFPEDLFVQQIKFQMLAAKDPDAARKLLFEKLLPGHPDYPPFLISAYNLSAGKDNKQAYQLGTHLLEIYPAAPGWKQISLFLLRQKNYSEKTG